MNQHAIVTGAAGNLGIAVVRQLIKDNFRITALTEPGKKDQEERLRNIHPQSDILEIVEADLFNEEQTENAFRKAAQSGKIDVAIMLVGGFSMGNIESTSSDNLQHQMTLNFMSAYHLARPAFLHMASHQGGRMVLVGAKPALDASAGKNVLAYALSKNLIFHLADYLNEEGKNKNIVTSVIVPSIIDTPPNREAMPDADFSQWVKPEQIAEVIAFAVTNGGEGLRQPVFKVYGNS